jgi:hypothetical protein
MINTNQDFAKKNALKIILFTGLLVGSLDILAAFIDYYIATGKGPGGVLKFIASAALGRKAFSGGTGVILLGLLFHFIIALCFTVLFYWLYPRIKFLSANPILTGIIYGIFIWLIMNLLVLPLSNAPHLAMKTQRIIKAIIILICMIGLPLSFIMQKYFPYKLRDRKTTFETIVQ